MKQLTFVAIGDFAIHGFLLALPTATFSFGAWLGGIIGAGFEFGSFIFGAVMLISFSVHVYQHWQFLHDELDERRHKREMEYIQVNAKVAPIQSTQVEPKIEFPPLSFIDAIFSWRTQWGKFPTVEECTNELKFQRQMVVQWWAQLVECGSVIGRIERKHPGDPNIEQGWIFDKFREMAIKSNSLPH